MVLLNSDFSGVRFEANFKDYKVLNQRGLGSDAFRQLLYSLEVKIKARRFDLKRYETPFVVFSNNIVVSVIIVIFAEGNLVGKSDKVAAGLLQVNLSLNLSVRYLGKPNSTK